MEDEEVAWYNVAEVLRDPRLIPNLRWLIPMALDKDDLVGEVQEQSFYALPMPQAIAGTGEIEALREVAEWAKEWVRLAGTGGPKIREATLKLHESVQALAKLPGSGMAG